MFFSVLISNAEINLFGDNFNFLAEMTIGAAFLYFTVATCLQCGLLKYRYQLLHSIYSGWQYTPMCTEYCCIRIYTGKLPVYLHTSTSNQ